MNEQVVSASGSSAGCPGFDSWSWQEKNVTLAHLRIFFRVWVGP